MYEQLLPEAVLVEQMVCELAIVGGGQGLGVHAPTGVHTPNEQAAVGFAPPVHPELHVYVVQLLPEAVFGQLFVAALAIVGADAPVHGFGLQAPDWVNTPAALHVSDTGPPVV